MSPAADTGPCSKLTLLWQYVSQTVCVYYSLCSTLPLHSRGTMLCFGLAAFVCSFCGIMHLSDLPHLLGELDLRAA